MVRGRDVVQDVMNHALVIGSQLEGLAAPDGDAGRIADELGARGFTVDLRTGARATRAELEQAWKDLAARCDAGSAAVVFYAGHGARFSRPRRDGDRPDLPTEGQLIVPFDFTSSTDTDFRGITSWELSLWLAALTRRTANVTLLLDCCYAATMARGTSGPVPRALPHPVRLGIGAYLDALAAAGGNLADLEPLGNPLAVRAFAAGAHQCAWEVPEQGAYHGVFTSALAWALRESRGAAVTWRTVGDAIRERVGALLPQAPDLGGPVGRELFSLHEPAATRAFSSAGGAGCGGAGATRLRTGRLLGTRPGDTFRVMPRGSTASDPAGELAIATATTVDGLEARVDLDRPVTPAQLDGALAFPLTQAIDREPVAIDGAGPLADDLRGRIAATPRLRVAEAGDARPLARIVVAGDTITIADDLSALMPALDASGAARAAILDGVTAFAADLAVARGLRALVSQDASSDELELTWGVVVQGAARPLPASGAVLGLRDRIYVRVVNTGRDTLYVHLFDVGTRRKVARLSGEALFGVEVRGHEGHTFGATPGGALTGFGLAWPDGVPREPPRPEELYVIAARRGVNLGALETEQAIAAVATRGGPVGQARAVGTRDASALRTDGYLARRIELTLRPVDAALASADAAVAGPRD